MKTTKIFLSVFLLMLCLSGMVKADGPQTINSTFNTAGDPEGWITTYGSTSEVSNGYLNCAMGAQPGDKYRGDLEFKQVGGFDLYAGKDVFLAIKFKGGRPDGALKMTVKRSVSPIKTEDLNWESKPFSYLGAFVSGNDSVYYYDLSEKLDYDIDKPIVNIMFKIADALKPPFSYSVDWVATFKTVEDIKAYEGISTLVEEDNNINVIDITSENGNIKATGAEIAKLEVFNLLGQNIATVESDNVAISTGIYVVRATSVDGVSKIAKIVNR